MDRERHYRRGPAVGSRVAGFAVSASCLIPNIDFGSFDEAKLDRRRAK